MNKDRIFFKIREMISSLYENLFYAHEYGEWDAFSVTLGTLRGYVHALGDMLIIPPTCEHQLCALCPQDYSRKKFRRMFVTMLIRGIEAMEERNFSKADYLLAEAVGIELPGAIVKDSGE